MTQHWKTPRIYLANFTSELITTIEGDQHHYLRNVLRKKNGDHIRVFGKETGEFLCEIQEVSKKRTDIKPLEQLREAIQVSQKRGLMIPPLKKDRMDWVIQKSVELGVTDIYPIITDYTEVRQVKTERVSSQIIEAAEQCERLDIPRLHEIMPLEQSIKQHQNTVIYAAVERFEGAKQIAKALKGEESDLNILIGPVGGFSQVEKEYLLNQSNVVCVSLGERILRTETAVSYVLSVLDAQKSVS